MKSLGNNLYLRNQSFYYRSYIPRRLVPILSLRELVFSLNVNNIKEARVHSAQIKLEEANIFECLNNDLRNQTPCSYQPNQAYQECILKLQLLKQKYCASYQSKSMRHGTAIIQPLLFSEITEQYLQDCKSDAPNTLFNKKRTFEMFVELIGDKPLLQLGIEEGRKFKSFLSLIPANAKKKYQINSLNDIDWTKEKGVQGQHPKTISNRLSVMTAFFNWAIKQEYYSGKNPFSAVKIKNDKSLSQQRDIFQSTDLEKLFKSTIYSGCQGASWKGRFQAGEEVVQDSLFWVPLIGLYTGLRLNEICQLYIEDIRNENGIFYFDINRNGEDKALKTLSSIRKVPVHNHLISKGLLQYKVQQKQKSEKRLFSDIQMGKNKTYSYIFSKRFTRTLEKLDIKRNGLCFHSFRHTFIDGLRNAGVERHIAMIVTGHSSSKDVHDHYGQGYSMAFLQEQINKLSFPEIEG